MCMEPPNQWVRDMPSKVFYAPRYTDEKKLYLTFIYVVSPGKFYAGEEENTFVLAMATDTSNDLLVTGDSTGRITIWDISTYCISRTESIIAQVEIYVRSHLLYHSY